MMTTDTAAPGIPATRGRGPGSVWWTLRGPLIAAAAAAAATGAVAAYSPYRPGSYGLCPVLALTGLYCPACGGLRAVHDLTQLDVAAAWGMNPAVVFGIPVLILLWFAWLVRTASGRGLRLPVWTAWSALAAFVVFGVARNTPLLAPWLGLG